MDVFLVILSACLLKGSVGDSYVNVTSTGCLSFEFKKDITAETVNIEKDNTLVFTSIYTSPDSEDIFLIGNDDYTKRIRDINIDKPKGTISFCLVNTTFDDGGVYICDAEKTSKIRKTLYVLDKPTKPEVTIMEHGIVESETGKLSCFSNSTSVPPGLPFIYTWFVNDTLVPKENKYSCNGANTCNNLIITVDRNDHSNKYNCFATDQYGQNSDFSDFVRIDPKRKPNVTIRPSVDTYKMLINTNSTIECVVLDAYPIVKSYIWTKKNTPGFSHFGKVYSIVNVTKEETDTYECTASNGIANGISNIFVEVLYGPTVTTMTPYAQINGKEVNKTCVVQSNPSASYNDVTWTKRGNSSFIMKGLQLYIQSVSTQDNGTFECTVNITFQPTKGSYIWKADSQSVEVDVLYGPTVRTMETYSQINGKEINKTCDVQSNPPARDNEVTWTKKGDSLFIRKGFQLHIPSISKKDHGTFECNVNITFQPTDGHNVWETDSQPIEINVLYGPEITPMPTYSQEEGHAIFKTCIVNSNPAPTNNDVTWTKQGNSSFSYKGVNLSIPHISRVDHGTYICTVRISLQPTDGPLMKTYSNETVEIDVLYGPTIDPMSTYPLEESTNLTIPCRIQSNPGAKYDDVTWTKQNNDSFSAKGLQLSIPFVNKIDNGTYVCNATILLKPTNHIPVVRTDAETVMLDVLYQPILSIKGGNTVYEGNTTTLFCLVNSNPLSNITWTYLPTNNTVLESNSTIYPEYNISSELKLKSARCEDTGVYRCQANNNVKSPATESIAVSVKCKPRLISSASKVENITIGRNESLNHTIEFHAFPQPMCELKFNNTAVSGFTVDVIKKHLPYKSGCKIEKNEIMEADIGPYDLNVNNSVGLSVITFYIIFQREPDPPLLHAIDCNGQPEAATILWKPRWNGGLKQTFFVQYKKVEDLNFINGEGFIDDGVEKMYFDIIKKLIPGKTYIFRVSASNDKGSAKSDQVNCTAVGKDAPVTDSLTIIGATTGSIVGIVVIVCLLVFVFFIHRRTNHQKAQKTTSRLLTRSTDKLEDDEDEDGLKVNPMYVTSGQVESDLNGGTIYSVVQKANTTKADEGQNDGDSSTVYSQVVKKERKGKGKKSTQNTKKKGIHDYKDQSIEIGCVYENANDIKVNDRDMYTNTDTDRKIQVNKDYKPKKNKDGLIYADLDLAPGSSDKRFIIRGIENRNNYAVIDLLKTAEPLPSDSDTDDEKNATQNIKSSKVE